MTELSAEERRIEGMLIMARIAIRQQVNEARKDLGIKPRLYNEGGQQNDR